MTGIWSDMFGQPDASCRHCGRGIWRRVFGWEDTGGFTICVKAQLDQIGHGARPDYVGHEPMPAGLRGAEVPAGTS